MRIESVIGGGLLWLSSALLYGEEPDVRIACSPFVAVCEWLAEDFSATFDISVDMTRMSSGEVLRELYADPGEQSFDLWWGGTGDAHLQAAQSGLLQPIEPANLDEQLRWSRYFWELSDHQSVGLYTGTLVLITNRAALAPSSLQPVSCWSDLGDPRYRGQLLIADPSTSGTSFTALATIMHLYEEAEATRLIQEISLNVEGRSTSGFDPVERVLAGERAITIGFAHDVYRALDGQDQISITPPCEGTGYEIAAISMTRDARNTELVERLVEYSLTAAAQNALVNEVTHQMFSNQATERSDVYQDWSLLDVINYDLRFYSTERARQQILSHWRRP